MLVCAGCCLVGCVWRESRNNGWDPGQSKTILISGAKMTKALHLAKAFHSAGHKVIFCETHKYRIAGHRFSKACHKFVEVPQPDSADYVDRLVEIVQAEAIDFYVPVCSPLSSYYDSQAIPELEMHCQVLHPHPSHIEQLDNKFLLAEHARSLDLAAPKSFLITEPQQVLDFDFSGEPRQFILKSIPYDSVLRLDLTKLPCSTREETERYVGALPISKSHPWVLQEFIPGREFCTHSTVRDGRVRLHCCCESSAFQVNYEHVDEPEIEDWVRKFVGDLNVSGQVSFDFIRAGDDGRIYAIECNPRTHSAITIFRDSVAVTEAYLGCAESTVAMPSAASSKPTYWLYHELWRILTNLVRPKIVYERVQVLVQGRDAVFDWRDPLPFLMLHHFQIPLLLITDIWLQKGWKRIDFNIGKLVQLGGD
jgi:predicted ATP-grasp superfamily ATP-dependent carboligase